MSFSEPHWLICAGEKGGKGERVGVSSTSSPFLPFSLSMKEGDP